MSDFSRRAAEAAEQDAEALARTRVCPYGVGNPNCLGRACMAFDATVETMPGLGRDEMTPPDPEGWHFARARFGFTPAAFVRGVPACKRNAS